MKTANEYAVRVDFQLATFTSGDSLVLAENLRAQLEELLRQYAAERRMIIDHIHVRLVPEQ